MAIWSHDSTQLAYSVTGQGNEGGVYVRNIEGSAPPRLVFPRGQNDGRFHAASFTADDKRLLIDQHGNPASKILVRDLDDPEGAAEPLLTNAWRGPISWDGRWLAYMSDSSGRNELYIRSLTPDMTLGPEIPIIAETVRGLRWLKQDGPLRLSYSNERGMHVVTIDTESGVSISSPEVLPTTRELEERIIDGDWLPDGRSFVIVRGEDEEPADEIRIVLNWVEELKTRTGSF
jgi:hypothetical protein